LARRSRCEDFAEQRESDEVLRGHTTATTMTPHLRQ
jgi:hypothetical protein